MPISTGRPIGILCVEIPKWRTSWIELIRNFTKTSNNKLKMGVTRYILCFEVQLVIELLNYVLRPVLRFDFMAVFFFMFFFVFVYKYFRAAVFV